MPDPATSQGPAAVEEAVRARYSAGALRREAALCCPVGYDPRLLDALPAEVVERDYGCGDPTRHVRAGETVLDLGSGAGKACFLASQVVGPDGRVIGVDMNDDMLAVARRAAPEVARRIGYANVIFRKGRIQDLAVDLEQLDARLAGHPVTSAAELAATEAWVAELAAREPLVADASIDVVVSNCVLNLVRPQDKQRLFAEILRVLRPGGRAVIADIVSDEDVPAQLAADPDLWSGCISGSFREDLLLAAFEQAGFHGIQIVERQERPWRVVAGIEFRSLTVAAFKGKQGVCLDQGHAVVYRGPFREVQDDDGHVFRRGARAAVCGKTYRLLTREPYRGQFVGLEPREPVSEDRAPPFRCTGGMVRRDPRASKGAGGIGGGIGIGVGSGGGGGGGIGSGGGVGVGSGIGSGLGDGGAADCDGGAAACGSGADGSGACC